MVHIEHDGRLGFSASLAALNGRSAISFREQRDDHSAPHQLVLRAVDPGGNFLGAPVVLAESPDAQLTYLGTSGIGEGAFIAIWAAREADSAGSLTSSRLMARVFGQDGAFLGPSLPIAEERGSDGELFEGCDVAALADGGVVIVWPRYDGIVAHRIGPDGTPRGASIEVNRVEAVDQSEQSDPHVASLSNGGFVVVWTDADHIPGRDGYVVMARQFDADGNAVGDATRVNRTVLPDPIIPHVTQLDGGRFVISWTTSSPPNDSVETGLLLNDIIAPQLMPSDRITAFHDGSAGAVVAFRLPDSDAITRIVSLGSVAITTPIPSTRQVDINLSWQIMGSMILVPVASLAALWAQDAEAREIEISAESGGLRFVERISLEVLMGAASDAGDAAREAWQSDQPAANDATTQLHRILLDIAPTSLFDVGEPGNEAWRALNDGSLAAVSPHIALPDHVEAPAPAAAAGEAPAAGAADDAIGGEAAMSVAADPTLNVPDPTELEGRNDDEPILVGGGLFGSGPPSGDDPVVGDDPGDLIIPPPPPPDGSVESDSEVDAGIYPDLAVPVPVPEPDGEGGYWIVGPESPPDGDTLDDGWVWIDVNVDADVTPDPSGSVVAVEPPPPLLPLPPSGVAVDLPSPAIDTLIWLI